MELTDEEIEEEKKKDKEEEDEAMRNPSASISTDQQKPLKKELRRLEWESKQRSTSWTEEKDSQLLFKYRLRNIEKNLAVFQYMLKFAPDPVQKELEESRFVQETTTLREDVRSLLTCEGVSHVAVAQLKDELGGYESDNYMDRDAARRAVFNFRRHYESYLSRHVMDSYSQSMDFDEIEIGKHQNITKMEDCAPIAKPSEDRQQLRDQAPEDPLLFSTPKAEFTWTLEAVVRLFKAIKTGHQHNPEVAAVLFPGL